MDLLSLKQRFGIIGNNEAMNRALEVAVRVAATDLSVLITGESGVGKEFFPQIIHANSPRKHGNYIAVNCGAIPEGTIDSELFGHEKGSFTGASESRKGYFEVADKGTIFLDEVAELPQTTQVRLLRVLQAGEFLRVGSSKVHKTDVRVVAATNIDLHEAIRSGRFREDLYYRLNTVPIVVPALRDRPEDIFLLFRKFAGDVALQYRMPPITLDESARTLLESYYWPGNIRQLKNVAEQISAVEESRLITGEIIQRYLPNSTASTMPIRLGSGDNSTDMHSERDLIYKILFDMRAEIGDLKRMVSELRNDRGRDHVASELPVLLPHTHNLPMVSPSAQRNDLFEDTEEVTDEPSAEAGGPIAPLGTPLTPVAGKEMTKEMAQREAIVKALRRHNGKRKEAARELFVSERTLYRKIKELGIDEF